MIQRIKNRINVLRGQPEHVRIKAATQFTIISGIVCVVIWLFIFLPLQLHFRQTPDEIPPEQQVIEALTEQAASPTPTPVQTPRPTPLTSSPASTPTHSPEVQGLQFLPYNEDKVSPTPTP